MNALEIFITLFLIVASVLFAFGSRALFPARITAWFSKLYSDGGTDAADVWGFGAIIAGVATILVKLIIWVLQIPITIPNWMLMLILYVGWLVIIHINCFRKSGNP